MLTRLASLCSRASRAVSGFQASAARVPGTLLAAICSPLPEPPMTTPSEPGAATVRSPTSKQYGGESAAAALFEGPPAAGPLVGDAPNPPRRIVGSGPAAAGCPVPGES